MVGEAVGGAETTNDLLPVEEAVAVASELGNAVAEPAGDWVALPVDDAVGDACADGVGVKRVTLRTWLVFHSVVYKLPSGSATMALGFSKDARSRQAPLPLPAAPAPASVPTTPAGESVRILLYSLTNARPTVEVGSNTMAMGPLKVAAAPVPSTLPAALLVEPARCATAPCVT